ncbi:MAG TPA: GGDEF domain-containing protein [Mycobacteriales bacterium]|nr:GGDEF domain-containing protein [Mycobacteriales bacterium]
MSTDGGSRLGVRGWTLVGVLALVAAACLADAARLAATGGWPAPGFALLVAGSELFLHVVPVSAVHRRGVFSAHLDEAALVGGMLLLPPGWAIICFGVGLTAGVAVKLARLPNPEQVLAKLVFNASNGFVASTASVILATVLGPRIGGVSGATVGAVTFSVLSLTGVSLVLGCVGTASWRAWLVVIRGAALGSAVGICLGLAAGLLGHSDPWRVGLVVGPVAMLLFASVGQLRARSDRDRLAEFLQAASEVLRVSTVAQIENVVVEAAQRSLGGGKARVAAEPPQADEVGAPLPGQHASWLIARPSNRQDLYSATDQQVVDTLASIGGAALENVRLRDALAAQARCDELTDLANRRCLLEELDAAFARAQRTGSPFSVLVADLDGLKPINDTFGHAAGDEVLMHVGHGLSAGVRSTDLVARIGGDEFAVLLDGAGPAAAAVMADALASPVQQPITLAGYPYMPLLSIGTASWPTDGASAAELLALADARMYLNKSDRRRRSVGGPTGMSAPPRQSALQGDGVSLIRQYLPAPRTQEETASGPAN